MRTPTNTRGWNQDKKFCSMSCTLHVKRHQHHCTWKSSWTPNMVLEIGCFVFVFFLCLFCWLCFSFMLNIQQTIFLLNLEQEQIQQYCKYMHHWGRGVIWGLDGRVDNRRFDHKSCTTNMSWQPYSKLKGEVCIHLPMALSSPVRGKGWNEMQWSTEKGQKLKLWSTKYYIKKQVINKH